MNSKVSIAICPDYEQSKVDKAVRQSLALLGGLSLIIKPGQKVLLKVNALMDSEPELAVTTHPAIVSAVIKEVHKLGAKAYVGDSPGNVAANIEKTMEKTGFLKAVQEAGAEILNFQKAKIADVPSPSNNKRINILKIAQAVLDADVIINLPKLKTHGWTLYTGAIKNMFGSVPGFFKSKYHIFAPQPHEFSEMLVDILEITKPQLNIMDAVIGMEGAGPSAGQKRQMGAIMASTDAVALDAVCSTAIGYKPFDIDTTKIAHQRNLGQGDLENIEVVGTSLSKITQPDWKHASSTYSLTRLIPNWLNFLFRPITRFMRVDPIIMQEKCTKCLICVKNCPAETIKTHPLLTQTLPSPSLNKRGGIKGSDFTVEIDLSKCIMCFCCHELCPYKAIKLKRSWLAKMIGVQGLD
ncbi:MAG: DUF362 domain-containing protein [Candidatus Margulisiibacteriota bacterium]